MPNVFGSTVEHIEQLRREATNPNFMHNLLRSLPLGTLKELSKSNSNKNLVWKISLLAKAAFAQDVASATALASRVKDITVAIEACMTAVFTMHYHKDGIYDHAAYGDDIIEAIGFISQAAGAAAAGGAAPDLMRP